VLDEAVVALPLDGVVDIGAESARLEKEVARIDAEIAKIDAKLSNAEFIRKAPEDVVDEQRERRADYAAERDKLAHALTRLKAIE
jgi:valyl-tRNA synthetase